MSDLLPHNATGVEHALDDTTARAAAVPVPVRDLWNAQTCPSALLPWLAWARSVDEWDAAWSDEQKRGAIAGAINVHRYKGTVAAVRESISALGIDCRVQEWFVQSPPGEPYTFDLLVNADQQGYSLPQLRRLLDVVAASKNLRSHLRKAVLVSTTRSRVFVGGATSTGFIVTVGGTLTPPRPLVLNGLWTLDGTQTLDGTFNG